MEGAIWDIFRAHFYTSIYVQEKKKKKREKKVGQSHGIQEPECGNQPSIRMTI